MAKSEIFSGHYIDGLMQMRCDPNAIALELRLFCIKPLWWICNYPFVPRGGFMLRDRTDFEIASATDKFVRPMAAAPNSRCSFTFCEVSTVATEHHGPRPLCWQFKPGSPLFPGWLEFPHWPLRFILPFLFFSLLGICLPFWCNSRLTAGSVS